MQEIFQTIQNDSTLMFVAGIALVVLLVIVLVVVVFSTKAKTLSDRLVESHELDRVKSIKIDALEKELQSVKITNAGYEQELQHFSQVREELASKTEQVATLQTKNSVLEKELSQTETQLENLEKMYENLLKEHKELQGRFEHLQEENNRFQVNNARLLMKLETESRHASSKLEMMQEHKKELKTEFERLAKQIFDGNSEKFAEFSKQNLDSMIKPLQTQIEEFKKQVSDTYNAESQDRAVLKNEINSLKELNEKISTDAINLTNALKGESKQQGVWGEMVLEHVLEASGLRKGHEFEREVSLRTDDNEVLRPDVIVHLPDNRDLIIDAKTSLISYERFINAEDEANKAKHLAAHLNSIKMHIEELSNKNYERLKEVNTLDFIFMFMPIEGALAVALEHDNSIYDNAFKKKILLVGPTTLLVAMRAVENVWKYERQNQNAQEIARRAGAMYDKFVRFSEDLIKISKQIDAIQSSFSAAKNKLSDGKGNLVRQVQQLKELGAQTNKQIPKELKGEEE
ncbi:DNA recombination protein RmuC [Sulfurovum sp. NBC37-1]|uniref:DNA recombination protein RmuC n=1 Tax=Sulfurovum sp. (strain NBC37-1) TaxID=387093 RepID=UPI0001587A83|nr:DNA recombination protein RmuC [Sulfurovum sp. NBC37-1]BAF72434.1 DNA recombination protein [Sulfurovum sp. NBC37-1]